MMPQMVASNCTNLISRVHFATDDTDFTDLKNSSTLFNRCALRQPSVYSLQSKFKRISRSSIRVIRVIRGFSIREICVICDKGGIGRFAK